MRFFAPVVPALAAILAGCGPPSAAVSMRPVLADQQVLLSDAPAAAAVTFDAPPSRVLTALAAAYDHVGIDVTVQDPATHSIGNSNFWKMHTLGGARLSSLVDCGSGMAGPRADSYRVYFSVISTVTAQPGGKTKVETQVVPAAVDVSGGSSDRIPCGSSGALEQKIHDATRATLGG